jgi:redox-sensitive bicupin YhaK (pirin superfamily)
MSNPIIEVKALGFPWETQDPFLFCAHHADAYPVGNENMGPNESLAGRNIGSDFQAKDGWSMYHGSKVPGFPVHPHRGFETVSIVETGLVDHTDSLGAAGRFGNGDVQWMTAGKGVQHSEMFPLLNKDKPNPMEMFQLWLNLPAKSKMVDAYFRMLWNEEIPVIESKNEAGKSAKIKVIAGAWQDTNAPDPTPSSWAADRNNGVKIIRISLEEGAEIVLPSSSTEINRTIYFYSGDKINLAGQEISNYHFAKLEPTAEIHVKAISANAEILFLEGKPIGEPVAQYGPFVMNTQEEIQQAMYDYQRTQYGGWPWPEQEQVHPKEKGRFAIHADGREELK